MEDHFGIGNLIHDGIALQILVENVIERYVIDDHVTGRTDAVQFIGEIGTGLVKALLEAERILGTYGRGCKGIDGGRYC